MKLQSLAIIFIIIIMPLTLVINTFIDNRIECAELELDYDTRLLNATYDAVKAYQLNTVNNQFGDITNEKVSDIEAAVSTLKNSLVSSFNYSGYESSVIDEYLPAVVFTTYDGYYVYSPYSNTLTNMVADDDPSVDDSTNSSFVYDSSYSDTGEEISGLKPYVTYSCEYYIDDSNDFIITYTLTNYITIEGMLGGTYHYDYGYVYNITSNYKNTTNAIYYDGNDTCIYDGITFTASDTEEMREYVGQQEYSYIKINGVKYYLDEHYYDEDGNAVGNGEGGTKNIGTQTVSITDDSGKTLYSYEEDDVDACAGIFYIDSSGYRNYSQSKYDFSDPDSEASQTFIKYYVAIKNNNSAFEYFKSAYEFNSAISDYYSSGYYDKAGVEVTNREYYVLRDLNWSDAVIWDNNDEDTTSLKEYANGASGTNQIFNSTTAIQTSTSNFNEHRKAIIRYTIETNLVAAIASFSNSKGTDFLMPKISEDDWEIIENDICAISFMQGMSIGTKLYNGYAVVANTLTNDYVDENDIYILGYDNSTGNYVYCKANDGTLLTGDVIILGKSDGVGKTDNSYYSGIWKINFETKQYANENSGETIYYIPMSYLDKNNNMLSYYGSYTSIFGTYNVNSISTGGKYQEFNGISGSSYISTDMYTYMNAIKNIGQGNEIRKAYYCGLARERYCSFNVNNINIELYGENKADSYFFKNWTVTT